MDDFKETFFTTVGCMDGRVQEVVGTFGREKLDALYPDTITDAGIVGKLPLKNEALFADLKFKLIDVSLEKHHSKGIIVHGHTECAGNPVDDETQKEDIRKSTAVIKKMVGSLPVIGVFVHRSANDPTLWVADQIVAAVTP
jgi:carbonic anhydrase